MTAPRPVEPEERDYKLALQRETLAFSWEHLKARAVHIAADRLACEALAKANALINPTPPNESSAEYLARQDAITRHFAEHERLMNIAFPETANDDE